MAKTMELTLDNVVGVCLESRSIQKGERTERQARVLAAKLGLHSMRSVENVALNLINKTYPSHIIHNDDIRRLFFDLLERERLEARREKEAHRKAQAKLYETRMIEQCAANLKYEVES